jgi:deoxyribodipyrimidine photo-lyase
MERVRQIGSAAVRPGGEYVFYWIRSNRRAEVNHALQFAAELANRLDLPLLCGEELTCDYPYANDRLHAFALEGVAETAEALRALGAGYVFDLALQKKHGHSGIERLAGRASAVVIDDWPGVLAGPLPDFAVATYAVDSSCIVPARCIGGRAYAAYSIRPKIRRLLDRYLRPIDEVNLIRHWPNRDKLPLLDAARCEIDHSVSPSTLYRGGRKQAERRLSEFLKNRLRRYAREKNEPSAHATSGLSAYLHSGYISALEVALRVREYAREHKIAADEFLEELIVRRELAFNFAWHAKRIDSLEELPEWARKTLRVHRRDRREPQYTAAQFERAGTHDELWNAAQKELVLRGTIHGYYRMYWGKKIIEWAAAPEEALEIMLYLNDKYALDGQDPNTYANILWCFGLHDRPWRERPIFGSIRYMSRSGMERKTDTKAYMNEILHLERTGKELTA